MPSRTRTTSRREDLLRAAATCFVEAGIRATTMEDIAATAGAGKATLYRYFANKDAVIDALLDREGDRLERRLVRAHDDAGVGVEGLRAAFVAGIRFFTGHPVLAVGQDEDPGLVVERVLARRGPMVRRCLDFWAGAIRRARQAGEVGDVDPRIAAEVIVRLTLSYFLVPPMVLDVDDDAQVAVLAHEVIDRGLQTRWQDGQ